MTFNKSVFLFFSCLCALSLSGNDKILSISAREKTITGVEQILESWKNVENSPLIANQSLFFRVDVAAPEPEKMEEQIVIPSSLSNQEALAIIANQLNPTGVLNFSGSNFLLLANGQRIKNDTELSFRIADKIYKVTIDSISSRSFRAKLGQDSLVTLIKNNSTNSVSFDNE